MELQYEWGKRFSKTVMRLEEESMFVHIREKYGESFHLITTEQDLVDVMVYYTKQWFDSHWLPREDWYFTGTYEEYFFKKMGLSLQDYDRVLQMCAGMTIEAIEQLKEKGGKMRNRYLSEQEGLDTAKFYRDVIDNGLGKRAGMLYNCLSEQTYNDSKMFSLECFNSI